MRDELLDLLEEYHKAKTRLGFVNERKLLAEKEVMRYRTEASALEGRIHELADAIESLKK